VVSDETSEQAAHDVVSVLPDRANDIARLKNLLNDSDPIVTVIATAFCAPSFFASPRCEWIWAS
jgi:hypothetical protein